MPNYIKDIVLGTENLPDATIHLAPILAYAREVWCRADTSEHNVRCEALGARELVDVWSEVVGGWDKNEQDAIGKLIDSLKFFGATMRSPIVMVTARGEFELDIVSGRMVKRIRGLCRQDHLARTWASELVKKYDKNTPPIAGDPRVRIPGRESIDADQIRKAGARLTSGNAGSTFEFWLDACRLAKEL